MSLRILFTTLLLTLALTTGLVSANSQDDNLAEKMKGEDSNPAHQLPTIDNIV